VGGGARRRPRPTPLSRKARPATLRKRRSRPGSPARGQPRAGGAGSTPIPGRARESSSIAETGRRASACRRKALRAEAADLLDGRAVNAVLMLAARRGLLFRRRARHGASETASPTLGAAEHAAHEERRPRLREEADGTSGARPAFLRKARPPGASRATSRTLERGAVSEACRSGESAVKRHSLSRARGRNQAVRIGCSRGRSIVCTRRGEASCPSGQADAARRSASRRSSGAESPRRRRRRGGPGPRQGCAGSAREP